MTYTNKKFQEMQEELKKVQNSIDRAKISGFNHYTNLAIGVIVQLSYFCYHIILLPYTILEITELLGIPYSRNIFSLHTLILFLLMVWVVSKLRANSDFRYNQDRINLYLENKYPKRYIRSIEWWL